MDDNASLVALGAARLKARTFTAAANNIANIGTTGFKAQGALTSEFVVRTGPGASISLVRAVSLTTRAEQGGLEKTGGPLDLAVAGDGFFVVGDVNEEFLTRNGRFSRSAEGLLQTADGRLVLDAGRAPIFVPDDQGPIAVAGDGTMSAGGAPFAAIGLVDADIGALERRGAALFAMPPDAVEIEAPRIVQGSIESSNVAPVDELVRIIETARGYEQAQRMMDDEDRRIRNVIESISRRS